MIPRVSLWISYLGLYLLVLLLSFTAHAQQLCSPCVNGEEPIYEDDDEKCINLVAKSSTLLSMYPACGMSQLENFQSGCCKHAPHGVCTLCPDGSSFSANVIVPSFDPGAGAITCADLNGNEDYLDYIFEAGTCADTLLRRSAAWCQCPGVARQCTLCPNGEPLPNPNLVDKVYYGWTCDTFEFVSSYFSSQECSQMVNAIFEFDAPSFCGCPNSPRPTVCNLCPQGLELINPNTKLGSGQYTCRDLALSTAYIPSISPCTRALTVYQENGFIDTCCGIYVESGSSESSTQIVRSNQASKLFLCALVGCILNLFL